MLIVDITATNSAISEELFRELISPSLTHLDALKGAFDRTPSTITYYPPHEQHGKSEYWSARGIVLISLGKARAEYLIQLYEAIVHLIMLELPDFEVQGMVEKYEFA